MRQRLDHLKFPSLRGSIYSDTMFAKKVKSLRGHLIAQVFTNCRGYDRFYPMQFKTEAPDTLMDFIHDAGIPQTIISDNAQEIVFGRWGGFAPNTESSRNKRYHTVLGPT